ncbi:uncharacterized protein LOC113638977 [Tachysurus fulvidraco]|uniref:uncharacterized protein LOC113638977 n=1 Tax=Tachysurus fulvidraco TaxID=1234273 RepID=UPI000F4E598B|nr:uncharacterized protein LOC113638977 [Tachysurus fulvidraco]
MAAIVTGLIPILHTAVDAATTDYKGRTVWFGFLCIRLVTLFIAEMPWFKLNSDFSCIITKDSICTRACFNQHFDKPVIMAWNYIFILFILTVLVMELFTAHLYSVLAKSSGESKESLGELKIVSDPGNSTAGIKNLDMHQSKNIVFLYLFSIVMRVLVEIWFVYILLYWNMSKLNQGVFLCKSYTTGCPDQECLVSGSAEKSMSIYALLSISVLVIVSHGVFCVHLIGHYLFNTYTVDSYNV